MFPGGAKENEENMTKAIIDADAEQAKRNEIRARAQESVIIAEEVEE